ncbi:SDR family oxidoreductase [Plantibacter sp. 2H11-2]|uniref:SDR family oxidoreductase n=1 Tax=Plantibacter sp. 2H11-2 TaxID=3414431 RepID=UPI003CEA0E4A
MLRPRQGGISACRQPHQQRAGDRGSTRPSAPERPPGDHEQSFRQVIKAPRRRQSLGRLVTPDEVITAITYLASADSGSTRGTVLTFDGGISSIRIPTV